MIRLWCCCRSWIAVNHGSLRGTAFQQHRYFDLSRLNRKLGRSSIPRLSLFAPATAHAGHATTRLRPEPLKRPLENPLGAQVLGDHNYVDEAASVRLPQSSSHFQARLQSSVLPGGRDQLQAVLRMPEAPKQSLNDRPFAGSSSGSSSGSGSSPAMLTKVSDPPLLAALAWALACGAGRGVTYRALRGPAAESQLELTRVSPGDPAYCLCLSCASLDHRPGLRAEAHQCPPCPWCLQVTHLPSAPRLGMLDFCSLVAELCMAVVGAGILSPCCSWMLRLLRHTRSTVIAM